jgi:hypothetical protein
MEKAAVRVGAVPTLVPSRPLPWDRVQGRIAVVNAANTRCHSLFAGVLFGGFFTLFKQRWLDQCHSRKMPSTEHTGDFMYTVYGIPSLKEKVIG